MITITRTQLHEHGACDRAIRMLDDLNVKDIKIENWNQAAQGFALGSKIGKYFLFWLHKKGLIPIWSMQNANLSNADLSGANLIDAKY